MRIFVIRLISLQSILMKVLFDIPLVVSGGFDCYLVKWNIATPKQSKVLNIGKTIYEKYDNSAAVYNPPHVYAILYDPTNTHYLAGLGNGALCSIKRKTLKISCYQEIHGQRMVDAILVKEGSSWLVITASNDLSLGLIVYEPKEVSIKERARIKIEKLPNAILFNDLHQAIYVADTSNDIKRIAITL